MSERTDPELVLAAIHGDERAFAELFDRHSQAVYRCARAVLVNGDDIAEVVQDVFLLAWRKGRTMSFVGTSAAPWLLVSCRNLARNKNRERRRNRADATDPAALPEPMATDAEAREELGEVLAVICALPTLDRDICRLVLINGDTYAEAATALGLTTTTVGKRLQRLRKTLSHARATSREALT